MTRRALLSRLAQLAIWAPSIHKVSPPSAEPGPVAALQWNSMKVGRSWILVQGVLVQAEAAKLDEVIARNLASLGLWDGMEEDKESTPDLINRQGRFVE